MTSILKPQSLQPGDRVGIITPASPPISSGSIENASVFLKKFGLEVVLGKNCTKKLGFLAGSDADRSRDLVEMFEDQSIKAIFSLRGGYGTSRFLKNLPFAKLARNPKILVGFSDLTSLQCALFSQIGLITFHGPFVGSDQTPPQNNQSSDKMVKLLFASETTSQSPVLGSLLMTPNSSDAVEGHLVGGNLTVLCHLLGTPFFPDMRGAILFLEDVGEAPYRIDRMLTHLGNAGVFDNIAAIVLGHFTKCHDPRAVDTSEFRQSVEDVLEERLGGLGVPVCAGFPIGHEPDNTTLGVGACYQLDPKSLTLCPVEKFFV